MLYIIGKLCFWRVWNSGGKSIFDHRWSARIFVTHPDWIATLIRLKSSICVNQPSVRGKPLFPLDRQPCFATRLLNQKVSLTFKQRLNYEYDQYIIFWTISQLDNKEKICNCWQYAPDVVPDMPQTCPRWCPRHAPDDAPDMPRPAPADTQDMPQTPAS